MVNADSLFMQIVAIYQSYGLGIEAVQEPVGVRLVSLGLLVMQKHWEQSMTGVAKVFNNFLAW